MALGFKPTIADSLLNALLRAAAYTGPATIFIQLHTGAPGAAGTTAVATNNTRKAIAFNASSGGVIASSADVVWTNVPATETYSHFSLWDASTAGNFLGSGTLTANQVTAADTFTVSAGAATTTLNVAS